MDDYPTTPEPYPASGAAARAALHQLIERLTDEEAAAEGYNMEHIDNFRERFEALEKQTEHVKYQTQAHKNRQTRWLQGIACGFAVGKPVVSLPLPSGIAQDEPSTAAEATDATLYAFATIDVPDAMHTVSLGINDRREIVGWFDEQILEYCQENPWISVL